MFKIGEFSKLTQVSIRMLRYYDETGLLKPEQTNPYTGYRMYSADQIPLLNKILFLRDSGFNVTEISEALKHSSSDFILRQFERKQAEIKENILSEQAKLKKIELAQKNILSDKNEMHYQVSLKSVPSYHVLSLRKIIPDYYAESKLWQEMSRFVTKHRISVSQDTFSIYHDPDYREKDVDVELCALTEKTGDNREGFVYRETEPVPVMACSMVYGPFENIAGAYLSMADWLQKHSLYRMTGQSRQIVHRGPWNENNSRNYLTEIQIPLEETT
ncbi:MerR family transcriptional regulator [Qiania dongpingensis]|uniref:MerR family transcriptional regulator n=1 Tax=Qiania dongpingensis TaxID=2763669 RepID=A0A7G9G536_9FIRM|nr:MerR family transcriptional regulator [Qiania dongpingensis]QNM05918.1 MerR family transcriptional regulator [Qiania dongpingensis]